VYAYLRLAIMAGKGRKVICRHCVSSSCLGMIRRREEEVAFSAVLLYHVDHSAGQQSNYLQTRRLRGAQRTSGLHRRRGGRGEGAAHSREPARTFALSGGDEGSLCHGAAPSAEGMAWRQSSANMHENLLPATTMTLSGKMYCTLPRYNNNLAACS